MKRPSPAAIAGCITGLIAAALSYLLTRGTTTSILFTVFGAGTGWVLGISFHIAAYGRLTRSASASVQIRAIRPLFIALRIISSARLVCAALCTVFALLVLSGGDPSWLIVTWFVVTTAMLVVECRRADAEGFVSLPWIGLVVGAICAVVVSLLTQGGHSDGAPDIDAYEKPALISPHLFNTDNETLLAYGAQLLLALAAVQTIVASATIAVQSRKR
jgi:hypothetical protein